jgi:hypothetical protein
MKERGEHLQQLSYRNPMSYKKKTENAVIFENASRDVPFTDLTSNQFIDGMRKIYELEPFISVYSI